MTNIFFFKNVKKQHSNRLAFYKLAIWLSYSYREFFASIVFLKQWNKKWRNGKITIERESSIQRWISAIYGLIWLFVYLPYLQIHRKNGSNAFSSRLIHLHIHYISIINHMITRSKLHNKLDFRISDILHILISIKL